MSYITQLMWNCFLQFIAAHNLRDTGAVASARAAEIYGLEILMDGIQVYTCSFVWSLRVLDAMDDELPRLSTLLFIGEDEKWL